jgi:YD repeat-containing protein
MRFVQAACLVASILIASLCSNAAFAIETYDDYTNRAATLASISASDGQFGEQLSGYNGATSFAVTDVALAGNSSLPVAVGRNHRVGSDLPTAPGLFGQWDIDLPHLHGIFAGGVGWQVSTPSPLNRCSSPGSAAAMKPLRVTGSVGSTNDDDFDGEEYWSGNRIHLPGGGDESLLLASTSLPVRPQGSSDYRWVTSGNWYFRCLPTLKNGAGEGFLAVAPDGTRYSFDWAVARTAFALEKPVRLGPNVYYSYMPRQKVMLFPSRVEDRFGNWVNYQWSGTQLLSIQSSDGRLLTLSYITTGSGGSVGPRVSAVTDGTRTWNYAYDSTGNLTTVTQPDGSKWTLNMPAASIQYRLPTQTGNDGCTRYSVPQPVRYTYPMTQPSGLTAEYTFAPRIHSRSRVWPKCSWDDTKFQDRNKGPGRYYHALSLVSKKIYGHGLSARTWDYKYWSGQQEGSWYDCASCPSTKTTEVTDSAGRFTRYTFSNHYGVSEGRLLKIELGADINTLSTIETYQHDTPNDTAYPVYIRQYGTPGVYRAVDAMEGMVVPLRGATGIREGTSFSSTTAAYDVFARPLQVTKASGLGHAKTDITEYHDDMTLWVLGQAKRQYTLNTAPNGQVITGAMLATEVEYNAQALPWRTWVFGKLQHTMAYAANGQLSTVTDGRSNTTTFSNWKRGIPQLIQYPATSESPGGASESAVVDDAGRIVSTMNEVGAKTCYSYDAMGRLASIVYPSETQPGVCDASRWHPVSLVFQQINVDEHGLPPGHWRSSHYEGNKHVNVYYDALWRPVLEETLDYADINGTLTQVVKRYDNSGRLSFQSYPTKHVGSYGDVSQGTRTFYDALDRVVRVEQDSEHGVLATTTDYWPNLQTRVVNPRGQATVTAFMAWDQPTYELPVASVQPEGKVIEIARHPQFGWPLALTQRNAANTQSQTRRYVYDGNAQLCKTIEPETGATVTGYEAAHNPAWSASGLTGGDYANGLDCSYAAALASGAPHQPHL